MHLGHCTCCKARCRTAVQVVAVDMAVYPPSYGVMIGDNIRETEASRLRTRGSVTTQQPSELHQPSLPNKPTPGRAGCLDSLCLITISCCYQPASFRSMTLLLEISVQMVLQHVQHIKAAIYHSTYSITCSNTHTLMYARNCAS